MAQSFSIKNYFKKIHTHELLADLYEKISITAILGITENTSRKNAVDIMMDFYKSLSPSQKIDIEKELTIISSLSTKHSIPLFVSLLKEKKLPHDITTVECKTIEDKVLYYYLYHKDIFDEVLFFHDFYTSRGYMLYEAREVDLEKAIFSVTELTKEFKRIANKDERATECDIIAKNLDGLFYLHATFEGGSHISPKRDSVTGEIDRTRTIRKQEDVKIVYLPKDNEVLISYTGKKYEKNIFLDTFLRIVCNSVYNEKIESFDLKKFKNKDFDFSTSNNTSLLMWKIKAITVSISGEEKSKKKMKLSLPSTVQEDRLNPLFSTLEELNLSKQFQQYSIENIALSFSFINKENPEKSVNVSCSLSQSKSSLCPLFQYDRYARTLLKESGIYEGFVEQVKKDVEKVGSKWSMNE